MGNPPELGVGNFGTLDRYGAPENACQYTAKWNYEDSVWCGAEAVYVIKGAGKKEFLACVEHAAWARCHPKRHQIEHIRSALSATAGTAGSGSG